MTQQSRPYDTVPDGNFVIKSSDQRTEAKIRPEEANKVEMDVIIDYPALGKVRSSCMALVIKHLLEKPHTCASLVQKIGVYGSSHINNCLRRLRKAGLIDAVWDFKQVCLVYYNLKLGKNEQSEDIASAELVKKRNLDSIPNAAEGQSANKSVEQAEGAKAAVKQKRRSLKRKKDTGKNKK